MSVAIDISIHVYLCLCVVVSMYMFMDACCIVVNSAWAKVGMDTVE